MTSKQDLLDRLIHTVASGLFVDLGNSITVHGDYVHVTQQNKADVAKGFIHDKPTNALERVREQKFNVVISFFKAMGMKNVTWHRASDEVTVTAPENWIVIYKSLLLLTEQGKAIFLAEPGLWSSRRGKEFLKQLAEKGYFLNALFELPPNSIEMTSLRPYLYAFSRKQSKKLFVAELTDEASVDVVVNNYHGDKSSGSLYEGIFIDQADFKNFQSYRVGREFAILAKHYQNYEKVSIKDIVKEVKTNNFTQDENSIYLRMAGNFKAVLFNEITRNKHVQLKLDPKKVNASYLYYFFNTKLGEKFLNSFSSGSYIPYLLTEDLLNAQLFLLPYELQSNTVKTITEIGTITKKLDDFESQILHDPSKAERVEDDLKKLVKSLTSISHEEQLLTRIREGEDLHTEFKSSLQWDLRLQQISKDRQHDVLRTICGFLNTDGGTLFIGVDDTGELLGIDVHTAQNKDKYLLRFRNLVKEHIGANYYPLIDYKIETLLGKDILVVNIKKSSNPVFLGKSEQFYVRTNPSTDELKGRELIDYIHNHFDKK